VRLPSAGRTVKQDAALHMLIWWLAESLGVGNADNLPFDELENMFRKLRARFCDRSDYVGNIKKYFSRASRPTAT
jgi:hypothetical protein